MSVSLSNSKDITVNRINLIQSNGTVLDLMSDVISNIEGGLTEDQLQTISDISTAINNDPNFFTNIQIQINNKQNLLNNYLPSPITNIILYNNNYIRTIRCRAGVTSFLETDPGSDNFNNYEINIDTNLNNLQNYYLKSYIDSIISKSGNFNFLKIPTSNGAINMLNSAGTDAVMAIGDTEIINYRPTKLREVKIYNSTGSSVLQQVDNLGITNMAFTYFNTDILVNGIADISSLAGGCLTQINNQISTTSYLKANVYTKAETLALNNLTNYNNKATTTSILTNYYNKTETLALDNLTNYNTKATTTSILTDYYNKTETLALNNLTNYNTKATTTSILTNYYNKTETLNISTFSNYYTKTTANSLLGQKQDTLSSYGVNGVSIFMNPTQLSNIMGGNNITVARNFPDGEIIISSNNAIDNNITSLTNYYNKNESLSQFSSIVQCDSIAGLKLFNKAIKNGYLWNNFKTLTCTSNLNLTENITDQTIIFDIDKLNMSGLSNYYNRSQVDLLTSNYYLKSEINTYFYDKVTTNSLLSNYYTQTTTNTILNNSYQEKLVDNGGFGSSILQFQAGAFPKNNFSRIFAEGIMSVSKYFGNPDPTKNGNIGISVNLNQDSTILYATSLSNLIQPNLTASNTITFPLTGNLDIKRPSNNSSLMFFDDMGITVACPLRVQYITDTDDLNVRGFIMGTGYARLMTTVDNHISTLSYPRSDVFSKSEIELNYNNITGVNSKLDAAFWDFNATGFHKIYNKTDVNNAPRCSFYYITGGNNLTITKDTANLTFKYDVNNDLSVSNITGSSLNLTAKSIFVSNTQCVINNTVVPATPTTAGLHLGWDGSNSCLQFVKSTAAGSSYIDFGETGIDYKARIVYNHASSTLSIIVNSGLVSFDSTGLVNYYTKTQINNLLKPFYRGIVNLDGTKTSDTGLYTFTVSRVGTGVYRVVFSTAMADANYHVTALAKGGGSFVINYAASTTTGVEFNLYIGVSGLADATFCFSIS